jgi:sulfide:quinone oxidoreductase
VVIGGGNGGLSVAGRLRRRGVDDVVVIEPNGEHVYKPLLSHVAGGTARLSETSRGQGEVTPRGVDWIQDAVTAIDPEGSAVTLASGRELGYEHLIVAAGVQHDWNHVLGLEEALATPDVVSNYEADLANKASHRLRDLRRGTAVFVQPPGPASCAGAAQKPMYQACDYWRATGVLGDIRVILVVPTPTIFGLPDIDAELERIVAEYGIEVRFSSELVAVDGAGRVATISSHGEDEELAYDVLSVEPHQSAPDWLKATPLPSPYDPGGFVEVDAETLRHPRYPNVWSLGDAADTTNSKSGGALRKQSYVVAKNLDAVLGGSEPTARYDGYSVCPFTVSRSTVVFAEFDDRGALKPTIPFWKRMYRENRLSWIFDRRILPWLYWHAILPGRL